MYKTSKKVVLGLMVGAMAVSSAMPAFAAVNKGNTSSEEVTYYNEAGDGASGTGDEFMDADAAFDDTMSKETKVEVERSSADNLAVRVPYKIVLNGASGETNDADYEVEVKGDIAGDIQVNVVPNTAHYGSLADKEAASNLVADNFKTKEGGGSGTGTFAMLDEAGVKRNITATVTQEDTSWTIKDDGTDTGEEIIDAVAGKGIKSGNVEVDGLSAGKWSNDIAFDISVAEV